MSAGLNRDFLANPERFLANHLLAVRIQGLALGNVTLTFEDQTISPSRGRNAPRYTEGQVLTVNIQASRSFHAQNAGGRRIPACEVVAASGVASNHSHRFSAYYLPFFNNRAQLMRLQPPLAGDRPRFYFTDEMTGCAFATEPGPTPRVGHFNFTTTGTDDGNIDDGRITREIYNALGPPYKTLKKQDYKRDAADHVTLVGVEGNAGWTFYRQRFEVVGMRDKNYVYKLESVRQL